MTTLYDIWDGNFAAGVALLARHGGSPAITRLAWERLQTIAATGGHVDAYNSGKLETALRSVISQSPAEKEGPVPDIEVATSITETSAVAATDRTRALHKLHSHHHALMVAATTDEERGEHARKIMREILPELDAEYDRIRAGATAEPPPKTVEREQGPVLNTMQMMKRLASVRTRIARLKNHLIPEAPDKKRRAQLEKELTEKTAEKERLENELA